MKIIDIGDLRITCEKSLYEKVEQNEAIKNKVVTMYRNICS